MKLALPDVWRDMKLLWQSKAEGLFAILGVFVFLPVFAQILFIETPEIKSLDWNAVQTMTDYYGANVLPLIGVRMVTLVGGGAMLALLLVETSPSPGEAIMRAFRFLPSLFLLSVLITFFVGAGLFAFIVPGLYFFARAIVAEAAMIAEGISNPFVSLARSLQITGRQGWTVLALLAVFVIATWIATQLVGFVIGVAGALLLPESEVVIATALIGALSNVAFAAVTTLFGVAIYRRGVQA